MKTTHIGTILNRLPEPTRTQVQELLLRPDVLEQVSELCRLLEPHRKALRRIGIVPGYAAYAMAYAVAQCAQPPEPEPEPEPDPLPIVVVEAAAARALDFITRN